MPLILSNLKKSYADKAVLADFSLTLPDAGVICFFGPSGCGKSTLFNALAGLIPLDGGTISGREGKKLAAVFQQPRLMPWLSAADNISAVCGGTKAFRKAAHRWLSKVGLEKEAGALPGELSDGMKQRVSIARALAYGGDMLLLDEPFTGLDQKLKDEIWPLIKERFKGKLILIITHHTDEAQSLADKIYYLSGPPLSLQKEVIRP
ncbi:MAG: ATP-binding cassette domain-containing protein, partial [Clostridiales bacterium]|nr:ATP-binding cassette domain-containing protein [Clostridiales bacterium]